jgi:hypothetical protein
VVALQNNYHPIFFYFDAVVSGANGLIFLPLKKDGFATKGTDFAEAKRALSFPQA